MYHYAQVVRTEAVAGAAPSRIFAACDGCGWRRRAKYRSDAEAWALEHNATTNAVPVGTSELVQALQSIAAEIPCACWGQHDDPPDYDPCGKCRLLDVIARLREVAA